jgi:hypothetical protein
MQTSHDVCMCGYRINDPLRGLPDFCVVSSCCMHLCVCSAILKRKEWK